MRSLYCAAGALLTLSIPGFAQTKTPCSQPVSYPLQSRAVLIIKSRPAGLHIVGTDQAMIHISCSASNDETAMNVAFNFSPTANGGKLFIEGPHIQHGNNGFQVKIEVPVRTNLSIRMFAGQITVEEVKGDKDIEVGAGQITISSIHDGDYRKVNASVSVGEVQARAFRTDQGGFFRKFSKEDSKGDYQLRAHVTTGQIELLGNAEQRGHAAKSD